MEVGGDVAVVVDGDVAAVAEDSVVATREERVEEELLVERILCRRVYTNHRAHMMSRNGHMMSRSDRSQLDCSEYTRLQERTTMTERIHKINITN